MVAVPRVIAVARPLLLTVATDVLDEVQMTCMVILNLVVSEKLPVAVNCRLSPTAMLVLSEVTDMEVRVAPVTVRVVVAEKVKVGTLPGMVKVAVMVAVPAATAVARPLRLTVATDVLDEGGTLLGTVEVQMTCVVISKLVPSEYAPEALNCWVIPTGMLTGMLGGLTALTDMEDRVAEVTVRVVFPDLPPKVAVMVAGVLLAVMAVARPLLSTTATSAGDVGDELQVTCLVISKLVVSE